MILALLKSWERRHPCGTLKNAGGTAALPGIYGIARRIVVRDETGVSPLMPHTVAR